MSNDKLKERMQTQLRDLWNDGYESRSNSVREFRNSTLPIERINLCVTEVLADPEIKRGLELSELEKQGKLAELADEQKPPLCPIFGTGISAKENGYRIAQRDMLKAGWLKCKPREEKQ